MRKRVVEPVGDGSLEGLVQEPAAAHPIELLQFAFELCYVASRPLLDDRSVEAAELRKMKQRPRALDGRSDRGPTWLGLQPWTHCGEWSAERQLPRRLFERGTLEQEPHRQISPQRHREI